MKETKDAYVFRADLPGVKDEDLEISLTGNRLTVSGHREQEKREQSETYYATERAYGSFSRTFTLPDGTDARARQRRAEERRAPAHRPEEAGGSAEEDHDRQGGARPARPRPDVPDDAAPRRRRVASTA